MPKRNLGPMRAATPPSTDNREADIQVERARAAMMDTGMTPRPDVEAAAMEEVRKAREREMLNKAAEQASGLSRAKGGKVYAGGGYVKAADGCAQRGKTRGRMI